MTAVIELIRPIVRPRKIQVSSGIDDLSKTMGRETPLYHAKRLTDHIGGAQIFNVKTLTHRGPRLTMPLGQVLLAKHGWGKKKNHRRNWCRSTRCRNSDSRCSFDMDCTIYMGEEDVKRQALNVFRMELLGAKVFSVTDGSRVLKDAVKCCSSCLGSRY